MLTTKELRETLKTATTKKAKNEIKKQIQHQERIKKASEPHGIRGQ